MSDRIGELSSNPSVDVSAEMGYDHGPDPFKVLEDVCDDITASPDVRLAALGKLAYHGHKTSREICDRFMLSDNTELRVGAANVALHMKGRWS
jgi:hypothetical protein